MEENLNPSTSIFNFTFKVKCIILLAIGLFFYIDSVKNEFALDDGIVITQNEFVQDSLSGGIKGIMAHDAYYSYYHQMNANQMLAGGRYRPLSIVGFAIENSIFGKKSEFKKIMGDKWCVKHPMITWHIMHFTNVLFYLLCIFIVFYFFDKHLLVNLKKGDDIAFLAALFFAIHPMHTEVVANIKSLDEILSLTFIMLTCIFVLRYTDNDEKSKKPIYLILSAIFYMLALFAKEYALTLIFLIPVLLYTVAKKNPKQILIDSIPFIGVAATYIYFRFKAVGIPYSATKAEMVDPRTFIMHMQRISTVMKIAVTLPVLILPVIFYYFNKKDISNAILNSLPYCVIPILFVFLPIVLPTIPLSIPNDEILNNPYMLATHSQKIASEIYVAGKYLFMLFVPYPLSADYSYNQLPYRDFTYPLVWLTIITYGAIIYWGIKLLLQKRILAFPIFFYLANLAMVTNFIIDVGATMGERLAFHSSLGFVVLLSYGIIRSPEFASKKQLIMGGAAALILLCGIECTQRNLLWKNDVTLFTHDVEVAPNSVMVLGNAGARFLDMAEEIKDTSKKSRDSVSKLIDKSITILRRAIQMHPTYTNSYLNLGIAFYKLQEPDSAKKYWDYAHKLYPDHPNLKQYYPLLANSYLTRAMELGRENRAPEAIIALKKGLVANNMNPDLWYNLGGAYFTVKAWDSARYAWAVAIQLKPDYDLAKKGMAALPPLKDTVKGIKN